MTESSRYSLQKQHTPGPGVFVIECLPLKRAYFGESNISAFFQAQEFFADLKAGICENKNLLKDFQKYGVDNFFCALVVTGPEYFDDKNREEVLQKAKINWSDSLY